MGDHAYHLKSINEAVKIASPFQMATNFQRVGSLPRYRRNAWGLPL